MTNEPVYCFNCENEARWYVDWNWSNSAGFGIKRTFMCQTCKDAFEFGQTTHENAYHIDELND